MNFKLRQLQGLLALARTGSFSRAAADSAMTQPAFSQMIRELEASVDVRLFDRTTRRVDLTDAGRALVSMIGRPMEELADAWASLRGFAAGTRGSVALALLPSAAFGFMIRALAAYQARHPLVQVRLHEEQNDVLLQRVREREVDFGIGILPGNDPQLEAVDLFTDELVAVLPAAHRLARRATLPWLQIAAEPLILLPRPSSVRQMVDSALLGHGITSRPAFEVANMVTAASMARFGLGITVLPWLAMAEMREDGLAMRRISAPRPVRRVSIVRRRDRSLTPAAAGFLALLDAERVALRPQAMPPRLPLGAATCHTLPSDERHRRAPRRA
jgi:LysR family transcriptional regulator, carnitine catabolism transcriptional activator